MSDRAVFLDRDHVLTPSSAIDEGPVGASGVLELKVARSVADALGRLRTAGFRLVITSRRDVARARPAPVTLAAMHDDCWRDQLSIDEIPVCPHDGTDPCDCLGPAPGTLPDAARAAGIILSGSFVVGSTRRGIESGRRAGCRTILIDEGDVLRDSRPDFRAATLDEAVDWILAHADEQPTPAFRFSRVKVFGDGADLRSMIELAGNRLIAGFTTNPTLMRKAGVTDYEAFARDVLAAIPDRPISFEVFSDDLAEMERQALTIASWGEHVYVKVPITNTRGMTTTSLVRRLSRSGVKVNVTAILTLAQVRDVVQILSPDTPACVSVFAGRIADTGRDPVPIMTAALELLKLAPKAELIWASPREVLNLFQADQIGCHIITVTDDILKKLDLIGRDLSLYSLDTVQMFYRDATVARFEL